MTGSASVTSVVSYISAGIACDCDFNSWQEGRSGVSGPPAIENDIGLSVWQILGARGTDDVVRQF